MEAINDSSKLISQALILLQELNSSNVANLSESIKLLENALEKLANAI